MHGLVGVSWTVGKPEEEARGGAIECLGYGEDLCVADWLTDRLAEWLAV